MNEPAVNTEFIHTILKPGEAPAAARLPGAIMAHAWRAVLKIKHVPFQLFDVTAMPVMMTLMFTFLFGGALAGSIDAYIQFFAPGVLVQSVVFITVYTGVAVNNDIKKGLHDRFRSLPNWQPSPVFGMLAGDLFRYSVSAAVVLIISLLIGFRPEGGILGMLAGLLLVLVFSLSLSWPWIIVGLTVRHPESVMTTSFLVLMPLTFISNIFVDPATMPTWLQNIVNVNPVSHLTTAVRSLMAGNYASIEVLWVLIASVVIAAIFAPIAMMMYARER